MSEPNTPQRVSEALSRLRNILDNYYLDDTPPAKNDLPRYVEDLETVAFYFRDSLPGEEPQPPQAAARVDIDALQTLYDASTPGRWFTGIDSLSPDQEFMAVIHDAVPAILKELRELRSERNRRLAECVDSMPANATLIKTTKLEALRSELAASQERERKLREMLKQSDPIHHPLAWEKNRLDGCWQDEEIDAALAQP